jgi:hypothetical protein
VIFAAGAILLAMRNFRAPPAAPVPVPGEL